VQKGGQSANEVWNGVDISLETVAASAVVEPELVEDDSVLFVDPVDEVFYV
jgi:hypothetical protein